MIIADFEMPYCACKSSISPQLRKAFDAVGFDRTFTDLKYHIIIVTWWHRCAERSLAKLVLGRGGGHIQLLSQSRRVRIHTGLTVELNVKHHVSLSMSVAKDHEMSKLRPHPGSQSSGMWTETTLELELQDYSKCPELTGIGPHLTQPRTSAKMIFDLRQAAPSINYQTPSFLQSSDHPNLYL